MVEVLKPSSGRDFFVPRDFLRNLIVSWADSGEDEEGRPVYLEEYLASQAPEIASDFGIPASTRPVRGVAQLTEAERLKVVIAKLQQESDDLQRPLTREERIKQVKGGSKIGEGIIKAKIGGILLIEEAVKTGRLKPWSMK